MLRPYYEFIDGMAIMGRITRNPTQLSLESFDITQDKLPEAISNSTFTRI